MARQKDTHVHVEIANLFPVSAEVGIGGRRPKSEVVPRAFGQMTNDGVMADL